MRAANARWSLMLLFFAIGCAHSKKAPPSQAQAPPLQTGKGTLNRPDTTKPPVVSSPIASPLPPPSAQNVPLPPAPPPRKPRHKVKTPPKPPDTTLQAAAQAPATAPAAPPATIPVEGQQAAATPIGQLTTGDAAVGEKTKHETSDLIAVTQQGLAGIRRSLSSDEKLTATQIRTFLSQAAQALDNGDADGAHTLATKAKLLLDELTKP